MTLGKRWYALRVEAGEGDEGGVRVHFPAVVEITDGERCAMAAIGLRKLHDRTWNHGSGEQCAAYYCRLVAKQQRVASYSA